MCKQMTFELIHKNEVNQRFTVLTIHNNLLCCLIFITSWSIAKISWICKRLFHPNTSRLFYSIKVFRRTINGDETWVFNKQTNSGASVLAEPQASVQWRASHTGPVPRAFNHSDSDIPSPSPSEWPLLGGGRYLWAAHLHTRPCGCHHGDILHAGRRDGAFQFISFSFSAPAQTLGSAPVSFIGRV